MENLTLIDVVNLVSAIASLILSVLAIWLSLYFYTKSKDSEKQSEVNVGEIKTQTGLLVDISSRMLDKFTDYSTRPKAADETFLILANMLQGASSLNTNATTYPTDNNAEQIVKYSIDVTIMAHFYSGMTNLAIQDALPERAGAIESENRLPSMLNASYEDYIDLSNRLQTIEGVAQSSLYHVYQVSSGWEGAGLIKKMDTLYITPTQTEV